MAQYFYVMVKHKNNPSTALQWYADSVEAWLDTATSWLNTKAPPVSQRSGIQQYKGHGSIFLHPCYIMVEHKSTASTPL